MIENVALGSLIVLFLSVGLNLIRVVIGPSIADRALASDSIILNLVGIAAVYSIYSGSASYVDLAVVFALLGFVGMVCFAKFLGRGRIIE